MSRERKTLAGPEKLAILKRYLVENVPISDLCDQHGLQPSQLYYWQAQLFEHGAGIFERKPGRQARPNHSEKTPSHLRAWSPTAWPVPSCRLGRSGLPCTPDSQYLTAHSVANLATCDGADAPMFPSSAVTATLLS